MQPFQCDLQPEIPKHPITTHAQAHPKQLEATVTMRQKKRQTDRSRNRRTQEVSFIAGCSHFTRKNTRFRSPASSPTQAPCITMRFSASCRKPARIYAHGNTRLRHTKVSHQSPTPKSHTKVSHQPSLSVFPCDVTFHTKVWHHPKSHTRVSHHWVYSYVMQRLTPKSDTTLSLTPAFIECILMWCKGSHQRIPKSNTTLHWVYSYVM